MALPSILPPQQTVLQRLFAEMPQSFSKDPVSTPALNFFINPLLPNSFSSSDYVTIVIADALMTISSSVSYVNSETIDINIFTIYDLVNYFNAKYYQYGIIASLPLGLYPDDGLFKATALVEGVYDIGTDISTIDRFTSLNYALLSTFSLLLIENQKNAKAALSQTDLRLTTEQWADFWGHLLSVDRTSVDIGNDIVYKKRILREAVYPKSNNVALSELVTSITGRDSSVVDGGNPMILGGSSASVGVFDFAIPNALASSTSASLAPKVGDATRSTLTVGGTFTGKIVSGQLLTAPTTTGLTSNTYRVSEFLTGSGGAGTYLVSGGATTFGPTTITFTLPTVGTLDSGQLGPSTGAGSFIVYLKKNSGETTISQSVTSLLTTVVNRWKPAGISFVIQSY